MSEHDEMMKMFCEQHGQLYEYGSAEERNMWLGWLGNFTLGWDAHKKYLIRLQLEEAQRTIGIVACIHGKSKGNCDTVGCPHYREQKT